MLSSDHHYHICSADEFTFALVRQEWRIYCTYIIVEGVTELLELFFYALEYGNICLSHKKIPITVLSLVLVV